MFFEFNLVFGSGRKKDHEPAEPDEFRDVSGAQVELSAPNKRIGFQPNGLQEPWEE